MRENCWIVILPDGSVAIGDWPAIAHFPSVEQAGAHTPEGMPRKLVHTCVTVHCAGCGEGYDGDNTIHFESPDEAHEALSESGGWTILPDGYLCDICNPADDVEGRAA
jgi:hypothetical protein